jgi:hypothetical protein
MTSRARLPNYGSKELPNQRYNPAGWSSLMVDDFDYNDFPLAYLISFRTYGTWLHGDERGSVSRTQNVYGTPKIGPNKARRAAERKLLKHAPVNLDARQRPVVEEAIREVCKHRNYSSISCCFVDH